MSSRPTPVLGADPSGPATMPGWHIYADLTPPEFMAARKARAMRVWVAIGLVLVVAGIAVGYDYARGQANEAEAAVAAEQATAQALRSQQQQFSGVTALQSAVDQARGQLSTLMASDVDVDALVGKMWAALPQGMTISQITVSVPEQLAGQSASGTPDGAAALDTSGAAHIGTVTLAGTGTTIDDVPAYIDKLSTVKGIYSPFPTSNQVDESEGGTSYSLQFTLTDALLTHLYATEGEN